MLSSVPRRNTAVTLQHALAHLPALDEPPRTPAVHTDVTVTTRGLFVCCHLTNLMQLVAA